MSEQIFNVNCGFFDAVNSDRKYTAEQMNLPYKRVLADGVFATQQGTPSSDLQVLSAGNGMNVTVNAGNGLFASKWFENPSPIVIEVPANNEINPRLDSVIVQVDTRALGRAGNVVYRTGTASISPLPPDIGTISNVKEYRIANIYVAPGTTAINNDVITDLRGSEACPWVTSLIQQVDTSTLYAQWQAAYKNYYDSSTAEFNQFLANLTSQLSAATNVIMLKSSYTSDTSTSTIPIGIAGYDSSTDVLMVFINGLMAAEGIKYEVDTDNLRINLTKPVSAGQTVNFVVLHSVIAANIDTTVTMIQQLDTKVSNYTSDSGWVALELQSGAAAYSNTTDPEIRCIGNRVYIRGAISGISNIGTTICTLPTRYIPTMNHIYTTAAVSEDGEINAIVTLELTTTGCLQVLARSDTVPTEDLLPLATTYVLG